MALFSKSTAEDQGGPNLRARHWVGNWFGVVVCWLLAGLAAWGTREALGVVNRTRPLNMIGGCWGVGIVFGSFLYRYLVERGEPRKGILFLVLVEFGALALGGVSDLASLKIAGFNDELKTLAIGAATGGIFGLLFVGLKYLAYRPWDWPSGHVRD